ncbi:TPA: hypothetical protein QFN59_001944 [Enterococcus faecium]
MPQESNATNKQIESLDRLIKEINELKSAVLNGTVIIESNRVSREFNSQILVEPRVAFESLQMEIEIRRKKDK